MSDWLDYLKNISTTYVDQETQPTITMSFGELLNGDYEEGLRNLYIIWLKKQALYVGIARDNIWNRWFGSNIRCHMYFAQKYSGTREGGKWIGSSPIGKAIAKNFPNSLKWRVELRHCNRVEVVEKQLIKELRPLFNVTYRASLTDKELKLLERLSHE